ncbi:MAG TPA: 1,2-phenylacetyl-CoA epoxidase subunit PaaC [Sporichthyaceae bacterium]
MKVHEYALGLGDDALFFSQRLSEWVTHAPSLEEEVALANIALDLLGQARTLLSYAGQPDGREEDAMAYRRVPADYRCVHLAERQIGDFAVTIARLLVFSAYQYELYTALAASTDEVLAGVAGKAVKEVAYHRDHAAQWTLRLGDGTESSNHRMQNGLSIVWPDVAELFAAPRDLAPLINAGIAVDPAALAGDWATFVLAILAQAGLDEPAVNPAAGGGRDGVRTPEFAAMHAEMTSLHLAHPGASW